MASNRVQLISIPIMVDPLPLANWPLPQSRLSETTRAEW